tara:strand:- start:1484 stop:2734 length:1251 start_codon:yes stop_codon:yes gene_type:complete
MSLKINSIVFYIIVICFISMAIPHFLNLEDGNIFLQDFYAKRIMIILTLPFYFYLIILYLTPINKSKSISKNFVLYFFIAAIELINSIVLKNKLSLIALDIFIVCLPFFFYILVYKTSFNIDTYKNKFFVYILIASFLVFLNIKLQFSYFSLLAIVFTVFFTKFNLQGLVLIAILPFVVMNSLIGKSSLIMLAILILYFFLFDKKMVSKQKKIYIALVPSVLIVLSVIFFWNKIETTGAYRNTVYFLRNTDLKEFKFKDMSTGHRIFEGQRVLEDFSNSNTYIKIFGNGFGATIDLSGTNDVAVQKTNKDLENVRHIHIGFFAVLHRYGLIGLLVYFLFILKILKSCNYVLKKSENYAIVLGALYVIIIIFDSFITFPHLMSNIMFWFIVFVVLREADRFKGIANMPKNDLKIMKT